MAVIGIAGWVSLGGAALGAAGSGDSESTGKKEPWAPAQPYILDNLKDTAKLKDYYQKNPFNQQQQTSYQNLFGDLDNFRQNTAPGLMDFANRSMTNSYQRQPVGNPGDGAGYTRGQGLLQAGQQQQQPQGLLQAGQSPTSNHGGGSWRDTEKQYQTDQFSEPVSRPGNGFAPQQGQQPRQQPQNGDVSPDWVHGPQQGQQTRQPGPFSVYQGPQQQPQEESSAQWMSGPFGMPIPTGAAFTSLTGPKMQQYASPSYGLIDWNAQNPFTNGAMPGKEVAPVAKEPSQQSDYDEMGRRRDPSSGQYFFEGG